MKPSFSNSGWAGNGRIPWTHAIAGAMAWMMIAVVGTGCGPSASRHVVVYAAQDRVFSEPVFQAFTRRTGIEVRPVYDNEATKTTGLAQRLAFESARPQADVWWSNEEMRTRQLTARGVLDEPVVAFGRRERVLVTRKGAAGNWSLSALTNATNRGRVAMAYPVFGSTATHFLMLRQRWGAEAWSVWCAALAANRPLLLDGNSQVVRAVARGDAVVGWTDSDDVAFGRREGLDLEPHPLPAADGMGLPNTVALVARSPRREEGRALLEYLAGAEVLAQLREAGAVDAVAAEPASNMVPAADWGRLLADLDPVLGELAERFVR